MYSRVDTERQRNNDCNQHSRAAKHKGVGKLFHKRLKNVFIGNIGLAHVSRDHTLDVIEVTNHERVVQSQLFTDSLDLFLGRALTRDYHGGVAAGKAHRPENKERCDQNDRDKHQQTFSNIPEQSISPP